MPLDHLDYVVLVQADEKRVRQRHCVVEPSAWLFGVLQAKLAEVASVDDGRDDLFKAFEVVGCVPHQWKVVVGPRAQPG